MQMLEWIRFILGTGLLLVGLGIFLLQVFGVFKFKYVLNRMHAAAMGDTLGIAASLPRRRNLFLEKSRSFRS